MTYEELKQIAESVGELHGWDFGRMRVDRDPVPWDYMHVVRTYLQPTDHVLDIGTGGGERFVELAPAFESGIGIDVDPAMIRTARANTPPAWRDRLTFEEMTVSDLRFADATFDVILNRQAPICVAEIARVLKPEGYFITQEVANGNMLNIAMEFGDPVMHRTGHSLSTVADEFAAHGCRVVAQGTYNVRYFVQDVPSLVFWLKAVCKPGYMKVPEDFDIEKHWSILDRIITRYQTPRGIETNERRELLIVQKVKEVTARS